MSAEQDGFINNVPNLQPALSPAFEPNALARRVGAGFIAGGVGLAALFGHDLVSANATPTDVTVNCAALTVTAHETGNIPTRLNSLELLSVIGVGGGGSDRQPTDASGNYNMTATAPITASQGSVDVKVRDVVSSGSIFFSETATFVPCDTVTTSPAPSTTAPESSSPAPSSSAPESSSPAPSSSSSSPESSSPAPSSSTAPESSSPAPSESRSSSRPVTPPSTAIKSSSSEKSTTPASTSKSTPVAVVTNVVGGNTALSRESNKGSEELALGAGALALLAIGSFMVGGRLVRVAARHK